jgi:hypothetical protein
MRRTTLTVLITVLDHAPHAVDEGGGLANHLPAHQPDNYKFFSAEITEYHTPTFTDFLSNLVHSVTPHNRRWFLHFSLHCTDDPSSLLRAKTAAWLRVR